MSKCDLHNSIPMRFPVWVNEKKEVLKRASELNIPLGDWYSTTVDPLSIDEVMEQQPLEQEGPMSIGDFNRADQALARQTSSRRDPLVTAGVVGNLDRNKIGHTQMGANKYNHLYGA